MTTLTDGYIIENTFVEDYTDYTLSPAKATAAIKALLLRLSAIESDEISDDAASAALLTTVNSLSEDVKKTKTALTAIRAAANVAGTLEELKADIVTATADI